MSSKVEDWFITPLEAHFEAQPTDGGRITILEDLDAYSNDELEAAVEWLKRGRQSVKTFPSPKECLRAIAAVAGKAQSRELVASRGGITAATYGASAVAFNAGRDKVPVIAKDTPQWEEWVEYYQWLGAGWILAELHERKTWTVPSHFPSDFDPRFRVKARAAA